GVTEIDQVHDIFVRKAPPISSHPALYGRSVGYRQSRTSSGHTGIHGVASVAEQILVGHHEIIIANELVFCRAAELQVIVGEVLVGQVVFTDFQVSATVRKDDRVGQQYAGLIDEAGMLRAGIVYISSQHAVFLIATETAVVVQDGHQVIK